VLSVLNDLIYVSTRLVPHCVINFMKLHHFTRTSITAGVTSGAHIRHLCFAPYDIVLISSCSIY